MTKQDLLNRLNDYNSKSNITVNINEEVINQYYSSVDEAYLTIVKVIVREYINLKYLKDIHTWDKRIESIVDNHLFTHMDDIIDSIIDSYDGNLDNVLEYIMNNSKKQ